MKNGIKVYLGVVALLMAFSVNAWAYPVSVNDKVTMWDGDTAAQYEGHYQAINVNTGVKFGVFCLEKNEYFSNGGLYTVKNIVDYAENGGLNLAPTGGQDVLDPATKWLFYHFLNKDILAVTGVAENDLALQMAIWKIEGELDTTPLTGDALTYYDKAMASGLAGDAYDVKVMNLVYQNGAFAQSQLVGAPVPEPSTFLLLGAGLLGAGLLRRRSRK